MWTSRAAREAALLWRVHRARYECGPDAVTHDKWLPRSMVSTLRRVPRSATQQDSGTEACFGKAGSRSSIVSCYRKCWTTCGMWNRK